MSEPNIIDRWELFLIDDIVINILSHLQANDVLRCRCVSKIWRELTLTPYFVDLHKQLHIDDRMILVDVPKKKKNDDNINRKIWFLDDWWLTAGRKPTVHCHPLYFSSFSQDGLLVMLTSSGCECSFELLIVNPIFHEKVKIIISSEWHSRINKVCGIYFNPTLKEHCALFEVLSDSPTIKPTTTYKILTLGPKPSLRDIMNPYKDRYPSKNIIFKCPTLVNRFLYWMIDPEEGQPSYSSNSRYYVDIMEFDIGSEEFKVMPYPSQVKDKGRIGIDLLNIDGFLTLVEIAFHQVVDVNMWTLKDRASQSWTSSHYCVDNEVYYQSIDVWGRRGWGGRGWMQYTLAYKYGVLLIRSRNRLYAFNLELGTTKVLGRKTCNEYTTLFSHDIRLSSLKNCKPVIRIGNRIKCPKCDSLDKKEASSSNSSVNELSDGVEDLAISVLEEGAGSSKINESYK